MAGTPLRGARGRLDVIAPMLAVAGEVPGSDVGWAYEFKWDGIRAVTYVDRGEVRALSRTGKDLTMAFPELQRLGAVVADREVVLDGELVAFDETGRPSFGRLQHRLNLTSATVVAQRAASIAASYLVFDVMRLDGESLVEKTYDDRRVALRSIADALDTAGATIPPAFTDVAGADVLAAATAAGLEGIVAKRRNSRYRPGERSPQWVKTKIVRMAEVVIGGWTEGEGERRGSLGALLLGVQVGGELRYAGKVGTGFDAATRRELLAALRPLATTDGPFGDDPSVAAGAKTHFVRPLLVGEVQFGEWTTDGHLRHTSWRGLRPDKTASEVVREP
jgi:bifunctional non-homologous end joining protein LigD